MKVLNDYIGSINPLGRDYSDPDTDPLLPEDRKLFADLAAKTDRNSDEQKKLDELTKIESLNDYSNANGRPIVIPKGRPVEFLISSRDVVHDFFLPNFRERLDAVPGMRGKLYLTANTTCKALEAPARLYTVAELDDVVVKQKKSYVAVANEEAKDAKGEPLKGLNYQKKDRRHRVAQWRYATSDGQTIVNDGYPITPDTIKDLRTAGIDQIKAYSPFYWEIVCEELCGPGHATMGGKIFVVDESDLSQPDYKYYFPEKKTVAIAGQ
jgi:hypothetical protein